MFTSHPIAIIIIIVAQTFILCVSIWLFLRTGWFSYIIFLIYLGGLIVLFIYISRLAFNEKFNIIDKELSAQFIFSAVILITLISLSAEIKTFKPIKIEINEFIFKIFSFSSTLLTTLTIIYLIITLIVVVKITAQFFGPLRTKR